MSKFKGQTENIQPSSSGESTEGKAQPSSQSANSDNTQNSIPITKPLSQNMLSVEQKELTTPANPLTTLPTTEKVRQHALVLKVALLFLLKTGLVKRYTVMEKDQKTIREIQIVFNPNTWTEDFNLK